MASRIFDVCQPREDVRKGPIQESDFAADLAQVLRGEAPVGYQEPARIFANTYPTRAAGIEAMPKEAAAYWLGMAMHRKHPRRVLMALRFLLIEPGV